MTKLAAAQSKIREWRENPLKFVYDEFKVEPDAWQRQLLTAFGDPDKTRIAMQACAGPGKTAGLAWCGWNFLACYAEKGEHPKGAAVSITANNLTDNLWAEMSKWRERSEFLRTAFEWTNSRIFARDHPETWFISARSFSKSANAEEQGRTLSGLHARYVLYLIDESGDIFPSVGRAAEQGLTTCAWGKILQAGNPTSHQGLLYQAATVQRHLWEVITINGDPDDPDRSPRIDPEWAREQITTYGRDNPWVMAYILGQFPPGGVNTLLGPDEVNAAMRRHLRIDQYDFSPKILGVDVAAFGDDRTVIFPRQGLAAFRPVIMRNKKPREIAARVAEAWTRWDADACFIDDTGGFGSGVIDNLEQAGFTPIPVNFSGAAMNPRYFNRRAEMHFLAAEWVKRGALPNMGEVVREATASTYSLKSGKFIMQDKAQVKKLLQFSPDLWDAFVLTFAQQVAPRVRLPGAEARQNTAENEWDPYDANRI